MPVRNVKTLRSPYRWAWFAVSLVFLAVAVATAAASPNDPASIVIGVVIGLVSTVVLVRSILIMGVRLDDVGVHVRGVVGNDTTEWSRITAVDVVVTRQLDVLYKISAPRLRLEDEDRTLDLLAQPCAGRQWSPTTERQVALINDAWLKRRAA
jgi:uncharacterized membrane protein YhaH (DUF805 family)